MRLDLFLTNILKVKSRNVAANLISEDKVAVNGVICKKPSFQVTENDNVEIIGDLPKYVGRGGLKLEKAISEYKIDLNDCVCLDIGASTGGFTDCMLQNNAKKVYAVDVGYNQLDNKLLNDNRVISIEKTDFRFIDSSIFEIINFISIDVSFISLKLILPKAYEILCSGGKCVTLIKPQFEAGKKALNKNGIVRNEKDRLRVCEEIKAFAETLGFVPDKIITSPITGGDGNIEYLICLNKN